MRSLKSLAAAVATLTVFTAALAGCNDHSLSLTLTPNPLVVGLPAPTDTREFATLELGTDQGLVGIGVTFFGGALHTLPFLITNIHIALIVAYFVVAFELVLIAAIRHRYFGTSWWLSMVQVVGGGVLVFVAALIFGNA